MTMAYIGLGANLGDPYQQLLRANQWLDEDGVRVMGRSSIYRSAPVGPEGQQDYLNAVLAIETELGARQLLKKLQTLEDRAGRRREVRWGPRSLDLDLLLYGHTVLDDPDLTVPHPRMFERNFVLEPLAELVGGPWVLPGGERLERLLRTCPRGRLERTALGWHQPDGHRGNLGRVAS